VPLVVRSPIEISLGLVGVNLAVVLSLVLSAPDTHPVTVVADAIGLAAFATTGAIVAARVGREEFDLLRITIVGVAMAFAGGATRDLLVTRVPLVVRSPMEISLGLVGVNLAVVLSLALSAPDTHPVTVVADAIGLAAFATTGAIVAARVGVAIASIKTVGRGRPARSGPVRPLRGLLRDLCGSRGDTYWVAVALGAGAGTAAVACAGVTVATRLVAVTLDWQLPTVQR
jgi:uncharacterized membrane protein YeiH